MGRKRPSPPSPADGSPAHPPPLPRLAGVETLSDLAFGLRAGFGARADLLSVRRDRRLERLSAAELLANVHSLALAFAARDVVVGTRVGIALPSCPEWHVVDLACHLLGAVTVPLDPSLVAAQAGALLRKSRCRWVVYGDSERGDLLAEVAAGLVAPPRLVALDDECRREGDASLTRLLGEGAERRAGTPLERLRGATGPEDAATIVWTSGGTGDPRGVVLSHRNVVAGLRSLDDMFPLGPRDRALSILPPADPFERCFGYLYLHRGARIRHLSAGEDLEDALAGWRPTVLVARPDLYARLHRALRRTREASGTLWRLHRWAEAVGHRHLAALRRGFVGPLLALEALAASLLVQRRARAHFGGRLRLPLACGAPLGGALAASLAALGVMVYEGYGLAEVAGLAASNRPAAHLPGSAGRAAPGVELRLGEGGEILLRGEAVTTAYLDNPEATREALAGDGWVRTGDLGSLDEGFLHVLDRRADLLTTAGGRRVAPRSLELRLAAQPGIARAVVVGHRRPFLAALLVPDVEELGSGGEPAEERARPEVLAEVERQVEGLNARLPEAERLRRWRVLPRDLSREAGELTQRGLVRRAVVAQNFRELIEEMYS